MSFSWKGLLGVGGAGAASASTSTGQGDPFAGLNGLDEKDLLWDPDELADIPNMLGMRNFGYTCYVNSVIQALYYCKPFRESLLAYSATLESGKEIELGKNAVDLHGHQRQSSLSSKVPPIKTTTTIEPQEGVEITFFTALRHLFTHMVSATVTPTPTETMPTSPVPTTSTSYLASGLSRKATTKSALSSNKASGNISSSTSMPSGLMLSPSLSLMPPVASTSKKVINSCSHIVVDDENIKNFILVLKKSNILFDSTAHQDAHELLNFILNRIGEDVVEEAKEDGRRKRTRKVQMDGATLSVMDVDDLERTWVHRVFEGILTNETRCLTCETVTSRDESFLDLSIDIERNSSVTACLRQFSASEMLCARNKFFCDTCSSLQEAEKRMKVKKLPNVLALHLKRFKYEEAIQKFVKLAYRVVFPFEMRLFNTSDDAQDPDKLYELFAIIVHLGMGPHQGHYISIIRVGIRWFVFDDETVTIIDEIDITRYFGDTPGAGSAYVLFYQAVDLDLQTLGLVDTAAERQKARQKAQEEAWSQQQKSNQSLVSELTAHKDIPSRIMTTSPALIPINDASPNEARSTPMAQTPSQGGVFGRKGTFNSLASPNDSSESKSGSSWFSSLRPGSARKPSSKDVVNNSVSGAVSNPIPFKIAPPPTQSEKLEDVETASISTSTSSRAAQKDLLSASKSSAEDPLSPWKGPSMGAATIDGGGYMAADIATTTLPTSLQTSPKNSHKHPTQAAGAAFAPVDRSLSRKEQEKIAKQSRRSSTSASSVTSPPNVNPTGLPFIPDPIPIGHTINSDARKAPTQRPSTAEPTPMPRRKTISRTFGFGRKADKN